jgi:uncharacterized sporulation protein YeaH/YhbH (DUF444 family)
MTDAAGAAQGVKREVETIVKAQGERVLNGMDVVRREDFEVVKAMAEKARLENERLEARIAALEARLRRLTYLRKVVAYIDPLDLQYNRFERRPKPKTQAVMFCLMDVSASMTEPLKELAKRFFMLLHLFLTRHYAEVDIVFIRHTTEAQEVDEETFFKGTETGGTVISSAFREMQKIVADRYSPADWNIYAAQASDGDNLPSDNAKTAALLEADILPLCQYYAYLEVGQEEDPLPGFGDRPSALWRLYSLIRSQAAPMAMRKVRHRRDIYPVFRDLFARQDARAKGGQQ